MRGWRSVRRSVSQSPPLPRRCVPVPLPSASTKPWAGLLAAAPGRLTNSAAISQRQAPSVIGRTYHGGAEPTTEICYQKPVNRQKPG